jgi:hypothetical protein
MSANKTNSAPAATTETAATNSKEKSKFASFASSVGQGTKSVATAVGKGTLAVAAGTASFAKKTITLTLVLTYILITLLIIGIGVGIFFLVRWLNRLYNRSKDFVSNNENNLRIAFDQIKTYESMYTAAPDRLSAAQAAVKGLVAKIPTKVEVPKIEIPTVTKAGTTLQAGFTDYKGTEGFESGDSNTVTIPPLADDEKALINYSVLTCNNAGYLGPRADGVFREDDAVRIAFKAGARAFVLRIDTADETKDPVLVVRNAGGDKISNNVGSIKKTIDAIAKYSPAGAAAEPIIIILFFNRLPSGNAYSAESQRFMQKVAESLGALKNRHLGLTPHGDFRRQGLGDKLFIYDRSEFDGKYIILTNADTKVFRQKPVAASEDLDLWVHARLFADTTEKIGITEVPRNTKMVSPRLETPSYFTNIPDERLPTATARTKVEWTIAMDAATPAVSPSRQSLSLMLDKLGVCSVPVNIFDDNPKELLEGAMAPDFYGIVSWRPKVPDLRYKKPKPIKLASPSKQLDAKAGLLPVPTA